VPRHRRIRGAGGTDCAGSTGNSGRSAGHSGNGTGHCGGGTSGTVSRGKIEGKGGVMKVMAWEPLPSNIGT
jgi:hypothetical protein